MQNFTDTKYKSERFVRITEPAHRWNSSSFKAGSTFTNIAKKNTATTILVFFVIVLGFYVYIGQSKATNPKVILDSSDILDLFHKHNCTLGKLSSKLCENLNSCIYNPSFQHCAILAQSDTQESYKLEKIKEGLENMGLILGGTSLGAQLGYLLKIRQHLISFLTSFRLTFINIMKECRIIRSNEGRPQE